MKGYTTAIAVLFSATGQSVSGAVVFNQTSQNGPVHVRAAIGGLDGNRHGFHVHQVNFCN